MVTVIACIIGAMALVGLGAGVGLSLAGRVERDAIQGQRIAEASQRVKLGPQPD